MSRVIFLSNPHVQPAQDSVFPFNHEELHLTERGHPVWLIKARMN